MTTSQGYAYKILCAEQRALARVNNDGTPLCKGLSTSNVDYVYDSLVAAVRSSGKPPARVVELFLANFAAAISASRE